MNRFLVGAAAIVVIAAGGIYISNVLTGWPASILENKRAAEQAEAAAYSQCMDDLKRVQSGEYFDGYRARLEACATHFGM